MRAEFLGYSRTGQSILGRRAPVLPVDEAHKDQIGYTSSDQTIHLAYDHPCMRGLNENGKHAFRCGVYTHELMHQLLTNFVITNRTLISMQGVEREILGMISNYVEDARIEHYAYQFIGGTYLKCLEFAIAWTYKQSGKISDEKTPFGQFILAIQQLGDMGLLKGRFTFPEAKECFNQAAPIFYQATLETNPRKVMRFSKEIFEISRPLWKDRKDLEEEIKKMMEEAEASGKSMHRNSGGMGSKPSAEASEEEGSDEKSSRRKMTIREVSRREYEEALSNSSSGKGGSSGASEMLKCKDATTAEEAAEAAKEAAEDAADAADAAKDAEQAAKEAEGTPAEAKARRAADRAKKAAERAADAAKDAAEHAKEAAEAAASGNKEAEAEAAKKAGRDALRASAAAKSAQRADDMANGAEGSSSNKTAQDAKESAEEAAEAAEEAAKAAENVSEAGDAEKAKEAAEKAKEAAEKAKAAAEKAQQAQDADDEAGESANAKAAEKAAKEAAKAAEQAANAASGKTAKQHQRAQDATSFDYNEASYESNDDSEVTDRAVNGARPDYSNCDDEINEDFDLTPTEFDLEDYALSDDDFEAIEDEVASCLEDIEKDAADAAREDAVKLPDFDIKSARIGHASTCLNRKIHVDDPDRAQSLYANLMEKLRPGINSLYGRLRNIFQNDVEVTDYRAAGKLNFKRVNSGRMTARVFDKHRLPSEKAKTAIMIMVDESGSMSGRNAETAKQTAIALAETFYRLNIPTYIIGFTADTSGYDAVHNHYVTWKNSMNERLRLLDITARHNNFDGYSIRYGGELLKRVNAEHKLMVVVSDGSPACSAYRGVEGLADTKDAIRQVKSFADVLGVLIGSYDVEDLQSMYGNDFINVKVVNDLFEKIAKRIVHIVNKWE